jgi:hypothetical protein
MKRVRGPLVKVTKIAKSFMVDVSCVPQFPLREAEERWR